MLGKRKSFSRPIEKPGTTRPVPRIRNALSENNLRILNARMGLIPPPVPSLPPSSQIRSRTPSSHRRKSPIPERSVSMSSRLVSDSPLATGAKRRAMQGRRYPSMDYFPLAQTTALGLMGGRIGVVQMGSAYKANKILGDVVLLVPENQIPRNATKFTSQYFCTPNAPRGSISKLEKIRGERWPVEPILRGSSSYRRPSMNSKRASMERIREGMEDNYTHSMDQNPPGMEQRRPSVDRRSSMEGGRTSTDGRKTSVEGRRMSTEGRERVRRREGRVLRVGGRVRKGGDRVLINEWVRSLIDLRVKGRFG